MIDKMIGKTVRVTAPQFPRANPATCSYTGMTGVIMQGSVQIPTSDDYLVAFDRDGFRSPRDVWFHMQRLEVLS